MNPLENQARYDDLTLTPGRTWADAPVTPYKTPAYALVPDPDQENVVQLKASRAIKSDHGQVAKRGDLGGTIRLPEQEAVRNQFLESLKTDRMSVSPMWLDNKSSLDLSAVKGDLTDDLTVSGNILENSHIKMGPDGGRLVDSYIVDSTITSAETLDVTQSTLANVQFKAPEINNYAQLAHSELHAHGSTLENVHAPQRYNIPTVLTTQDSSLKNLAVYKTNQISASTVESINDHTKQADPRGYMMDSLVRESYIHTVAPIMVKESQLVDVGYEGEKGQGCAIIDDNLIMDRLSPTEFSKSTGLSGKLPKGEVTIEPEVETPPLDVAEFSVDTQSKKECASESPEVDDDLEL